MPPKIRDRSVKALQKIVVTKLATPPPSSSKCVCPCLKQQAQQVSDTAPLTPELKQASSEGWNMIKSIAFPSLPALLQDMWVYLELLISILAFCVSIPNTFPIEEHIQFNSVYFALSTITMVLALIDAYVYFIEIGSCARIISKMKKTDSDTDSSLQTKSCCKPEVKEKIKTFFDIGRNIFTELLLYPLLIFDLFGFIIEETFGKDDPLGQIDYSMFIISNFYLILAVYIMRLLILFGSLHSLTRLPRSSNNSLLIKFCIHACGQILVHLVIILVLGVKIHNENPVSEAVHRINERKDTMENGTMEHGNDTYSSISASPFLWTSIVLGWVLPMTGTASFFIVNYYWVKEFSVEFWIDMVSLLQGASFAETVLGGDGLTETKDKTLGFVNNVKYKKVKTNLEKYKSASWWIKFYYPLRVPVAAVCGIIYDVCLIAFILSLMFTYDGQHIQLAIFTSDPIFTPIFFVSVIIIIIANLHILLLLNSALLLFLLFLAACISFICLVLPVILLVIFPAFGIIGHSLLMKKLCCSLYKHKVTEISFDNLIPAEQKHTTV